MKNSMMLISSSIIYLFIFAMYLELSPSLGNVLFRTSSDGFKKINLPSFFGVVTAPFRIPELWRPENWDLNYFVGVFVIFGLLRIYKDYKRSKMSEINKQILKSHRTYLYTKPSSSVLYLSPLNTIQNEQTSFSKETLFCNKND